MMQLPMKIRKLIANEEYKTDDIGKSDSSVLIFKDKVLKVQKCSEESENEYNMMLWLKGKLPIPNVLAYEVADDKSYMLMSKCDGEMSCEKEYMQNPRTQAKLLADGLQKLWSVDIADCPVNSSLKYKLAMAEYNVVHGLVDIEDTEPETFGENGFKSPEDLLTWLYDNQPEEELVLSHGDYCLPNVFGEGEELTGFIDLGKTGLADKWCDIALCYRSLSSNFQGKYDGKVYPDYDEQLLFRELGIEPDWEKIRYYILLDELF